MNLQNFEERDKEFVLDYLTECCEGTDMDAVHFCHILFEEARTDEAFYKVLREWINGAVEFSEITVHGFCLSELAEIYDEKRIGILIGMYMLHLEKQPQYHGIAGYNGQTCLADWRIMEDNIPCEYAERTPDGEWYFIGKDIVPSADAVAPYDLWRILVKNPMLITILAVNLPVGTKLLRNETKFRTWYDVILPYGWNGTRQENNS